jgi:hypothetical protein
LPAKTEPPQKNTAEAVLLNKLSSLIKKLIVKAPRRVYFYTIIEPVM